MNIGDPDTISDKELVDYTGTPNTVPTAQIERLIQIRTKNALIDLGEQVKSLATTIYHASQSVQDKADSLIQLYNKISSGQARQQTVVIVLTIVIAISSALYTWITYVSVQAMREANEIQHELLQLERKQFEKVSPTDSKSR